MDERPRDDIIELIQGLLAKTEARGATEAEASSAASKVQELLGKYNLSMAEITPVDGSAPLVGQLTSYLNGADGKAWLKSLSVVVASAYYCRVILSYPKFEDIQSGLCRQDAAGFIFIGREVNAAVCGEMLKWLEHQIWDIAKHDQRNLRLRGKRMGSYLEGMVATIGQRLRQQRNERDSRDVQMKALTIRYAEENSDYVEESFPNLRKGRRSKVGDFDAFGHGAAAGQRVSLNSPARQLKS